MKWIWICIIVFWLVCGLLAFRLLCRADKEYRYNEEVFEIFPSIVVLGSASLITILILVIIQKINKKRLYEFIVGKEPKRKNTKENE